MKYSHDIKAVQEAGESLSSQCIIPKLNALIVAMPQYMLVNLPGRIGSMSPLR